MVQREKRRRFRYWFEWHEIKFERYVITLSIAFFFFAIVLPTTVIMILPSFRDFTIPYFIEIMFFVGFLCLIEEVRTFPNMIGLSDEMIILKYKKMKYKKTEPREFHWGGISHIVFPKRGKGRVKIITHHGDTVLLRLSRRVVKRLKEFWDRAESE